MKNILFGTFVLFVIVNTNVQSQNCCVWSENFTSYECGVRQNGDELLFNDVRQSSWTTQIDNRVGVNYNNIYVTFWRAELTPNWWVFSHSWSYTYFQSNAGISNSTLPFTLNITGYGFPQNNTQVPYDCILQQADEHEKEQNTVNYFNPKYH